MKYFLAWLALTSSVSSLATATAADRVTFIEKEDQIEVWVDGALFTAWRHKDWLGGYLYPVTGPDGKNITRNYPMVKDFPNEQQDHPHHRSIRFSHRDVNGYSYWSPDHQIQGRTASVRFAGVKEMVPGDQGKLVFANEWLADGKVLLDETVTMVFHPLPQKQMLMDYDEKLTPRDQNVTFRDQKDGGMMIRVAESMKAYDAKEKKKGNGVITNSLGDIDDAAWGKRAEWCDYSGPGLSGQTVGIAIFDHPSNLRFPTHWHARTYGLLTANRFGKGSFEAKNGAKMGDGDYTIEKGKTLELRHRFYFHLGGAAESGVAGQYSAYASGK